SKSLRDRKAKAFFRTSGNKEIPPMIERGHILGVWDDLHIGRRNLTPPPLIVSDELEINLRYRSYKLEQLSDPFTRTSFKPTAKPTEWLLVRYLFANGEDPLRVDSVWD